MWNLFWFDVLTPPVFVAGSTRLGATHDIDFGASFLIAPPAVRRSGWDIAGFVTSL